MLEEEEQFIDYPLSEEGPWEIEFEMDGEDYVIFLDEEDFL